MLEIFERPSTVVLGLIAACGMAVIARITLGASLLNYLMGFFVLSVILPPLVLTQFQLKSRFCAMAWILACVGLVWLVSGIGLMPTARCFAVLIGFAGLLAGIATTLAKSRIAPLAASAITVVIGLLWLTWPVWLSPYFSDAIVAHLVAVHPLFAINGVLVNFGTWSHMPIAYRELTTLGQDVPYSLPTSIWPSVLVHLLPGVALLWVGSSRAAAAGRSAASPSSEAVRS
jgi:hypothetical protein